MKQLKSLLTICALMVASASQAETETVDTLHEVIVTGTNSATQSNLVPYSVTTVSHDQIEATGQTQLLSALTGRIPSLFVTQRNIFGFGVSNGGSGGIKLRGVGGSSTTSQLLMMVDGKPQFAGIYSHPVADIYESEYVDHVEVVRGPASVLYGSNAMGGAINVITKNPQKDGVNTTASVQYGSYNTWQSAITNMTRFGKFSSVASVGYDQTDGTQENFDFKQVSAYAKLGYDFSKQWNAYADYSVMKFIGNDPIFAKLKDATSTDIYHQNVLRGEASVVANNQYDKTNGSVRLYFSHGHHEIQDPTDFEMFENRIGLLAYQNYQPWRMTNFTLGFDFNRYSGKIPMSGGKTLASGAMGTMERQFITEYSPYLTASQGVFDNLLVFNAGMRVANSNRFGTHVLPQGGITLNPGCGWTVKASVAKGYRNPSFKELYLYKMANPDLNPETMMNYEVSIGKRFSHWATLELTGYIAKGDNLIQQVFSEDLGHQFNVNTGKFTNKGLEFTVSSQPIQQLNLRASYSVLQSDVKDLTAAPKHQYYIGADWTMVPKLILNADLTGVSRLYVAEGMSKQNYALLNLRLTYKVKPYIDLFVQGNNITDARYCINKGYVMPGITATGGFKVRF